MSYVISTVMSEPSAVVVLAYTVMDGTVLRWYHSESAAKHGGDYMSASRNGVYVNGFLDRIPDGEIAKAEQAAAALAADPGADVSSFATHEKAFGGGRAGEVTRIKRQGAKR